MTATWRGVQYSNVSPPSRGDFGTGEWSYVNKLDGVRMVINANLRHILDKLFLGIKPATKE